MADTGASRVFISYRRHDAAGSAGRVHDSLADFLPSGHLFMDVDSIAPGDDFVERVRSAVTECNVLLAVIGPSWDPARLVDPRDLVRLEIEIALEQGLRVIPVLVDGAVMPSEADLPDTVEPLARRQAVALDHLDWSSGIARLRIALGLTTLPPATSTAPGPAPAPPTAPAPVTARAPDRPAIAAEDDTAASSRRRSPRRLVAVAAAAAACALVAGIVVTRSGDDGPAAGSVLFRENFNEAGSWPEGFAGNATRRVGGGGFEVILVAAPGEFTRDLVPADLEIDDAVVEVTVRPSGDAAFAVWCRGRFDTDGYELAVASDGAWVIRRHDAGTEDRLGGGDLDAEAAGAVRSGEFRLAGRCEGDDLAVLVDGREVGTGRDPRPLGPGRPGVGLRLTDLSSVLVTFDDIAVRAV